MSLTLTLDLPEELASRFIATLPEEERVDFALSAIADALAARQDDALVTAALYADLDPDKEAERDAAECRAIVEAELQDIDAGGKLLTLEEVRQQWDAQKAARQMAVAP